MKLLPLYLIVVGFRSFVYCTTPWPYLHIYPPVNASDGRIPLYFSLMLSSAGFPSILAVPGVQIALDYINSEPSILPGYTLHYTLSDSQCSEKITTERMFEQLKQSPVKLGWLGSGCSLSTAITALWTQLYNLTQVSCLSSSPTLTGRNIFRYYFQMQPSALVLGRGFIAIMKEYGWKRFGLITLLDPAYSSAIDVIKRDLDMYEIEFSETFLSEDGQVLRAGGIVGGDPFDPDMRIFVLAVPPSQGRWLACQAYRRGIRYPTHQFFVLIATGGAWLIEPNPTVDFGCSLSERIEALEFALTVSVIGNSAPAAPIGGLTESEFAKRVITKARSKENEYLNLTKTAERYIPAFSISCYEATFVLAKALQNTCQDLIHNQTLKGEAGREVGLSEEETFTLANFTYSNAAILQRMFHHISSTEIHGINGRVGFDKDGIRELDRVTIMQYRPQGGNFFEEIVGTIPLSKDSDLVNQVQTLKNITRSIHWTKGIPTDGMPVSKIVTVSVPITVIFTIAGVCGIVFAASFGMFNFVFREKRIIRLSSPKLNYLIVWGAIHFYLSAIGLVIPTTDPDTVVALCFLNLTIIYTAYSLCYGTILVKMFRVWYIFNNHTLKKKINLTDFRLGCAVMSLVGIDLFIILSFVAVQGLRDQLDVNLVPSPEEHITLLGPTAIVQENFVYACDSDGRTILIIMLYISKILLQVFSLILAFWTRNVKVKGLDDSKYIPSAIYVSTIVLPISLTAAFTLRTHVNAFPAVMSTAHLFGATTILLIVFVPRMIGLYRDPTGINIFDNRHSSPNYDENDVVALRRDVQQLRVSLHFAQQKRCKCSSGTGENENSISINKTSKTSQIQISPVRNTTASQDHN